MLVGDGVDDVHADAVEQRCTHDDSADRLRRGDTDDSSGFRCGDRQTLALGTLELVEHKVGFEAIPELLTNRDFEHPSSADPNHGLFERADRRLGCGEHRVRFSQDVGGQRRICSENSADLIWPCVGLAHDGCEFDCRRRQWLEPLSCIRQEMMKVDGVRHEIPAFRVFSR